MSKAFHMNKAVLAILFIAVFSGGLGVGFFGGAWWQSVITYTPNPYDFAIVFATGGLGDKSFNDGCYNGAEEAAEEYDLTFTYSEPVRTAQYEGMLRDYCEHIGYATPYKIIISIGFDQADALTKVAADFPAQQFAIVDVNWLNTTLFPKIAQLTFDEEQGSALVGALAGLYTTEDKIGFVGGMDIPLIRKFAAGYFWGANVTNAAIALQVGSQSAHVSFTYVGDWVRPDIGESQADGQYAAGADIIFAAAGRSGLGVIDSAVKNNGSYPFDCWAIGVDSPQMYLGCPDPNNPGPPTVVLTSMLKRVDVAVKSIVKDACVDIDFTGGVKTFNLANGGVGWEHNDTLLASPVPAAYVAKLNMISTGIVNGTYVVPKDYVWL